MNDTAQIVRRICKNTPQSATGPCNSANLAAIVGLLKLAIAHLLEDVGMPRLVDLEGFAAVGADDFVHGEWTFLAGLFGSCLSILTPIGFWRLLNGHPNASKPSRSVEYGKLD